MPQHLRRLCQLLLAVAVVSILPGCGKSSPDKSGLGDTSTSASVQQTFTKTATVGKLPPVTYSREHPTEEPAWLTDALEDPDPKVRIQALATWAQHPGDSLDPVTYALVDPDESVRVRAQELLEEALARR